MTPALSSHELQALTLGPISAMMKTLQSQARGESTKVKGFSKQSDLTIPFAVKNVGLATQHICATCGE